MASAQVRSYAFITDGGGNSVTVVDTSTGGVAGTVVVGNGPTGAAVTPDGRRAYVANRNSNTVSVIDASALTVIDTIAVGSFPEGIVVSRDGAKAFVTNSGSNSVDVIDVATNTKIQALTPPGLNNPRGIVVSPDGATVYVTSFGNGFIFPIDVATHAVGVPIAVGTWPSQMAITPDGARGFVANYLDNTVSVIDLATQMEIAWVSLPVGSAPSSVAVSPDGNAVAVTNYNTHRVTVFHPYLLITSTPITNLFNPFGIAFSPDGSRLHVINSGAGNLLTYDATTYTFFGATTVGGLPYAYSDNFIGPSTIVPVGGTFNIFGDGTFTQRGFDRFINFDGGTLRAMADVNTTRQVSVLAGGGTIDANGFNMTLGGGIIGDGMLTKVDAGTLTLTGTSTHTGVTRLTGDGGKLIVDGDHSAGPLWMMGIVFGNTLGGTGTVGNVTVHSGRINPGAAAPGSTGILRAANINMSAFTGLVFDINGTVPGAEYDRIETSGSALFTGAVGVGVNVSPSFSPTPGQTFMVLTNVDARFGGPADGAVLASENQSNFFSVSYDGGDGNDLVLTALQRTPSLDGLTTITVNEDDIVQMPITVGHVLYQPGLVNVTTTAPTNPDLVPAQNVAVTFGGTIASRIIQIWPLPNASGETVIGVTAEVNGHSTSQTFLLRVNAVNDLPTISAIGAQSTPENTPLAPIEFTVSDVETDAAELTITATSSNPAIVPDANLTIGGSGAMRTIAAMPRTAGRGETIITLTVSDGTDSVSTSFTLTITEGTYYLAEGATGEFFDTDILIANPNETAAPIVITFLTAQGQKIVQTRTLAATSRTTIHAEDVEGLEAAMFSTIVKSSDALPLVVERTMRWDASGYGAHTEKATAGAMPTWYFAEGATGFFSTFLLLANPHATENTAHVTYFRDNEPALVRDYVLTPGSRRTIDAWDEPELRHRSFGARVAFDLAGVAERAMYFGSDPLWIGGHAAAGTTAPSRNWFFAEGATGSYFTTFLLLANPHDQPVGLTLTYYPASGVPVTKTDTIQAGQRMTRNIAMDHESLANAAVATRVEATRPIVAERSQYWGQPEWIEAHNSPGVPEAGVRWGLAEGRVGGADAAQTYILLANPNGGQDDANVTITFLRADGTTVVKTFTVPPSSRFNVSVVPGEGNMAPELIDESFGARIESTLPIVVERSVYSEVGGVTWAAGTNATATRLP